MLATFPIILHYYFMMDQRVLLNLLVVLFGIVNIRGRLMLLDYTFLHARNFILLFSSNLSNIKIELCFLYQDNQSFR